jgi:hypothetical protein
LKHIVETLDSFLTSASFIFAGPDEVPRSEMVYLTHKGNLLTLFMVVVLVDANSVHPDKKVIIRLGPHTPSSSATTRFRPLIAGPLFRPFGDLEVILIMIYPRSLDSHKARNSWLL